MLHSKDRITNEKTIYQTRQNPIVGCKKVIFGIVLLIIICCVASTVISFIGNMQTYLISFVNFTLTRYAAIALFVIIIFIILYIIWHLLKWYSTVYTLTNYRIITETGILRTKKSYMQYRTIQDINTSQSLIGKLINVGSISVYSAYDNNDIELENISNPSEVEEILFNAMHPIREEPQEDLMYQKSYSSKKSRNKYYNNEGDYRPSDDYYYDSYEDDYRHSNNPPKYRRYEYYDERDYQEKPKYKKYEYERYPENDNLEDNINSAMNDMGSNIKFEGFNPEYKKHQQNSYENQQHDYRNEEEYYDSLDYEDSEPYYNDPDYESMEEYYNNNKEDFQFQQEETEDNQKSPVERHFDKFKK